MKAAKEGGHGAVGRWLGGHATTRKECSLEADRPLIKKRKKGDCLREKLVGRREKN